MGDLEIHQDVWARKHSGHLIEGGTHPTNDEDNSGSIEELHKPEEM